MGSLVTMAGALLGDGVLKVARVNLSQESGYGGKEGMQGGREAGPGHLCEAEQRNALRGRSSLGLGC